MLKTLVDFGIVNLGVWKGPIRLWGYGAMLVLGFLVGIAMAQRRARRAGENPEVITHLGIMCVVGGILGSRLAYVIQHWDTQYAHSPNMLAAIFNFSSGGLIYYGGVVLATALVLIYLLVRKLSGRRFLDYLAISMMVGLAFGRAGCLLNGCCYGSRCKTDWALSTKFAMYPKPLIKLDGRDNPYSQGDAGLSPVYAHQMEQGEIFPDPRLLDATGRLIPPGDLSPEQVAIAEASLSHPVQPAQILGIINALLLAGILTVFYRLRTREGQVFAVMLILYPITRFALESIRDSNAHDLAAGILTHNQYTSIVTAIVGVVMLLWLRRRPPSAGPNWAERLEAQTNNLTKAKRKSSRNRKVSR